MTLESNIPNPAFSSYSNVLILQNLLQLLTYEGLLLQNGLRHSLLRIFYTIQAQYDIDFSQIFHLTLATRHPITRSLTAQVFHLYLVVW